MSSTPPGAGLSEQGREEALALRETLAYEEIDLGIASQLLRTQETLALALGGREVPTTIFDGLNEINFGAYEGGPLADYRIWAWTNEPDDECPGGGESRTEAALRFAAALDVLVGHSEERILVVSHALPLRYVIDASDGRFPAARIDHVDHATPFVLTPRGGRPLGGDDACLGRGAALRRRGQLRPRSRRRRSRPGVRRHNARDARHHRAGRG